MAVVWKEIAYKDDLDTHASQHAVSGSDTVFPADPGADKYLMWDDDPGELVWATPAGGSGCSIKTGTYTGDGTTGQAITGVGFQPKYVRIFVHPAAVGSTAGFERLDQSWGIYSLSMYTNATPGYSNYFIDDGINSLDADGFTVDDNGNDSHPNKDEQVYDYLALG